MKWRLALAVSFLAVVPSAAMAQALSSWDEPRDSFSIVEYEGAACAQGELLVMLDDADSLAALQQAAIARGDRVAGFIPRLAAGRLILVEGADLGERVLAYSQLPIVRLAAPNLVGFLSGEEAQPVVPNDPGYPAQWHLDNTGQSGGTADADIDAPEAWLITRGSSHVTVAVIDTGIDIDSPEFAGRLLPGWDFASGDPDPSAVYVHGTKVSGLLGANALNGFEVLGIDHECMILPIRVGNKYFTEFNVAQAIEFAAAEGADIVSMSLGSSGDEPPPLIDAAVAAAAASGAILVAAGGNSYLVPGAADKTWPGACPYTIAVGWTDHDDLRSPQSSEGNALDFMAPGMNVITVSGTASGEPKLFNGSSAATPVLSGIVALLKSLNRSLTYDQVYDLLIAGAEDQLGDPLDTPGWDMWYGHGRVNAYASLQALCGCNGGEPLIASPQTVAAQSGGVVEFVIDFGRDLAHKPYLVLGSSTVGAGPYRFGGITLRLAPDAYLLETLAGSDGITLIDTSGLLDADGRAHAMIVVSGIPGIGPDLTLSHQAVVLKGDHSSPLQALAISNKTKTVITGP